MYGSVTTFCARGAARPPTGKSKARKRRRKAGAVVIAVVAILLVGVFAYQGDIAVSTAREVIEDVREGTSDAASEIQDGIEDLEPSGSSDRDAPVPVSQDRANNKAGPGQRTTESGDIISGILQRPVPEEEKPSIEDLYLRHDPQLRIGPSMPIILQMCAPKHATFV